MRVGAEEREKERLQKERVLIGRRRINTTGNLAHEGGLMIRPIIVRVPIGKHDAYHRLFQNKLPDEVARELNWRWIDPDYKLIAVPKRHVRRMRRKLRELEAGE